MVSGGIIRRHEGRKKDINMGKKTEVLQGLDESQASFMSGCARLSSCIPLLTQRWPKTRG
jgi:hypothetical protein